MNDNYKLLYDNCAECRNLNYIEGFNPKNMIEQYANSKGEAYYDLDAKTKKLWFRLCYPNGKITKKIHRLDERLAVVEVRIYTDKADPEENYIGSALSQKFYSADDELGQKYLESAVTIATGTALSEAGFGIQLSDYNKIGNMPDYQSDNSGEVKAKDSTVTEKNIRADESQKNNTCEVQDYTEFSVEEYANQADEGIIETVPTEVEINTDTASAPDNIEAENNEAIANVPIGEISKNMPTEEIMKIVSLEDAKTYKIPFGVSAGKTLGQIYNANYRGLVYYQDTENGYNGPDNLLRACAKLLYEHRVNEIKAKQEVA